MMLTNTYEGRIKLTQEDLECLRRRWMRKGTSAERNSLWQEVDHEREAIRIDAHRANVINGAVPSAYKNVAGCNSWKIWATWDAECLAHDIELN